jgi:hypothetical protein
MSENRDVKLVEEESKAWNVGKAWSAGAVLLPLLEVRRLTKVCLYGCNDQGDGFGIPKDQLNRNRVEALDRMLEELKLIIEDTRFIYDKQTYGYVKKLRDDLNEVELYIKGVSSVGYDARTRQETIIINEPHFSKCLTKLRHVASGIKHPLNKKHLIFGASEELDLDKIKREIIEGG